MRYPICNYKSERGEKFSPPLNKKYYNLEKVEQQEGVLRAVLVAVIRDRQEPREAMEFLDELEFLANCITI